MQCYTSKANNSTGITQKCFRFGPDDSNMPANLENATVATGLEKGSFHSNPKVR